MIPIPYGEQRSCTVGASAAKAVVCEECGKTYAYLAYREGQGTADNLLWLNTSGATAEAQRKAETNVQDRLATAVDPVPCPNCGRFQTTMIPEARRNHLYRWHRFGLWTSLFSLVLILPASGILEAFPGSLGAVVILRATQAALFGGIALMVVRFVFSRRFDPNKLSQELRLRWGRAQAILLPAPDVESIRTHSAHPSQSRLRPGGEVPDAGTIAPDNGIAPFNRTDGAMDAAQKGPKRPLLYMFQYVALPEAAFENHPELIRELEGEQAWLPLLHFRSRAELRCIEAGLNTEDDRASGEELFKPVAVHPQRRNGYTVHVVTMPTPESPPEAHFVAIVHKDDEPKEYMQESPSTRYFALEKSDAGLPFLCECRRDGSRRNYGAGPAPNMSAFVEAVFERINAVQPGSNRVLLERDCAALMMFAPPSSTGYHSVSVEFEDGTRVSDAKVYRKCELELPPEFIGKKIKSLAINARQP